MTTRWKRLTALMLILLTLLNAGSALAAEEFWKWGDVYEEKLILGLPTEVTDLQVFQDELYFIYGDLLLKCHEPDDTPEKMDQEEILRRIRPYLGEEAHIKVEIVDEIPVLASGKRKRRYAVCFL